MAKRPIEKKNLVLAVAALATAGISTTSLAQYDFLLEEIIITAQKRPENLQDVPISVNALSGDKLADAGLGSLEDVQAYVPNLTIAQGAISSQIFIRGFGSGLNQGFEQSVGMYADGIHYGRAQQSRAPFVDLERVEVLRGPQSILFGKNSIAGAISMISAKPTDEFEASVSALYEPDHGEQELNLMVSGPITDSLRGRLAIRDRSMDGYMKNLTLTRDEAMVEERVIRGTLSWDMSHNTDVTLKVEQGEFDSSGRALEVVSDSGYGAFLAGAPFNQDAGVLNTDLDYKRSSNGDFSDNNTDNVTLTVNHDLGIGTLTAVTGYSGYEYSEVCDCDFTGAYLLDTTFEEEYEQFSQEIRFATPKGETVDWIGGVFFQTGEIDFSDTIGFGPRSLMPTAMSMGSAGALALQLQNTAAARTFEQETDSWSVFAQATWNVQDNLRLTFGGRYTAEKKDAQKSFNLVDLANGQTPTDPVQAAALPTLYASLNMVEHTLETHRDESAFTPSFTVEYDYSGDTLLYATVSTGFKSGGFDARGNTAASFEFEEEEAQTIELGAKMALGGRVEMSAALFYTEFDDLQVSIYDGVLGFNVGNAAKAVSQGLELDGRWAVVEGLTLTGAMAYLDFEFDGYENGQCPEGVAADSVVNGIGYCDYSGKANMYSPELTATLTADYVYALSDSLELRAAVDLIYSDDYYVAPDLDEAMVQDGYTKVNARLALGNINQNWELALVGKNLTDEEIMTFGTDVSLSGNFFGTPGNFALLERPRSLAIQAHYSF